MKRGDEARAKITQTITSAFADNFLGIQDKKIFVKMREGTEDIQFAISITMSKSGFAATQPTGAWQDDSSPTAPTPVGLSAEDSRKVDLLMQKLGLN